MKERKVDFESLEWQNPLPGARFKVFRQGNRRLRLVEFTRGFVEPNWCAEGHIGYVLAGQMDVDFDGNVIRFSAGNGLFIPAGAESRHKASVVSDIVRLILVEDAS
jgi:quercetin dioxygenase-like cupin family protein